MKWIDTETLCSHCTKPIRKCKKKKQVWEQLLNNSYNAWLLRKTRDVPNTYGLYWIRDKDEVLYIGYTKRSVRKRLLAHTGGYDSQKIGEFLKGEDLKEYSISWVNEKKAECLEDNFIDFVTIKQGFRPMFNLKR